MLYRPGTDEIDTAYWNVANAINREYQHRSAKGQTKEEFFKGKTLDTLLGERFLSRFESTPAIRAATDAGLTVYTCWWGEMIGEHQTPKILYNNQWIDMSKELQKDFSRTSKRKDLQQTTACPCCKAAHDRRMRDLGGIAHYREGEVVYLKRKAA